MLFRSTEWRDGLDQQQFRSQLSAGTPALVVGNTAVNKSNVLKFPGGSAEGSSKESRVAKLEDMESKAIISAIQQYRGNLTEAAKALGIGRATLYRKVKLYQIDPNQARKRKAA